MSVRRARVLVIAPKSSGVPSGIGRYAGELIRGLRADGSMAVDVVELDGSGTFPRRIVRRSLHAARLLVRSRRYQLVHALAPAEALPLLALGARSLVTIHDLSPFSPEGRRSPSQLLRPIRRALYHAVTRSASGIIAVSSSTKGELLDRLGVPEARIRVVGLGVDGRLASLPKPPPPPYRLGYLGDLVPRKRLDYLLATAKEFRRRFPDLPLRLTVCGGRTSRDTLALEGKVLQAGLEDVATLVGSLPDDDIGRFYNELHAFLWPSDYEGFGLPILEAQRCGVPVMVRRDARIPPEVAEGCLLVSSPGEAAEELARLFVEPGYAARVSSAGIAHAEEFPWVRTIDATIGLYREVLRAQG